MVRGVYAGSFDPLTNGHLDIIERSFAFCDELDIAIGINSSKQTMFDTDYRVKLLNQSLEYRTYYGRVKIAAFHNLLIEYARSVHASVLIRGIRSVSDFEYEINLANVNKMLAPEIETVFLPTSPDLAVVSSSMVKEIAKHGG